MKCYFYEAKFRGLDFRKPVLALKAEIFQQFGPEDCDWYFYPRWLRNTYFPVAKVPSRIKKGCRKLAYWHGNEKKHIIFEITDSTERFYADCVMFRPSVIKQNNEINTYSVPFPQRSPSYNLFSAETVKPQHLVSFCGDTSVWKRKKMIGQVIKRFGDHANTIPRKGSSCRGLNQKKKTRYGLEFCDNLLNSHFALCPRGAGPSTRRIFEAMAAGRVPVIVSPGFIKPFSHTVDWRLFSFHVKSTVAALDIIDGCTVSKAIQMGKLAQEIWHDYIRDSQWWKSIKPLLELA